MKKQINTHISGVQFMAPDVLTWMLDGDHFDRQDTEIDFNAINIHTHEMANISYNKDTGLIEYNIATLEGTKYNEETEKLDYCAAASVVIDNKVRSMRVGKFLRLIGLDLTQRQIDNFIGYVSCKIVPEIVSGEAIMDCYLHENYTIYPAGNLDSSCMRFEDNQRQIAFYAKYPEVFNLVVIRDTHGMVQGRALLWTLHNAKKEEVKIMDKFYGLSIHYDIVKKYASEHGYQTMDEYPSDTPLHRHFSGIDAYTPLPYIDTFKYVGLTNKGIILSNMGSYVMLNSNSYVYANDTDGFPFLSSCDICGEMEMLTSTSNGDDVCDHCLEDYVEIDGEYCHMGEVYFCDSCGEAFKEPLNYSELHDTTFCDDCGYDYTEVSIDDEDHWIKKDCFDEDGNMLEISKLPFYVGRYFEKTYHRLRDAYQAEIS